MTHFFAVDDSATFTFSDLSVSPGSHRFSVRLILPGDEDSTNNTLSETIFVGYFPRSVLVNEIMYAPSGGPEWIECVNNSADTISLSQWKVGDNTTSRGIINSQSPPILPRQFFIAARDSSILNYYPSIHAPIVKANFPVLNNDFDAVVILDPTGSAVDSVAYNSSWGGTGGKSLERIDTAAASNQPGNWGSSRSPQGATPGTVNSLTKKEYDVSLEKIFLSPSFPTAGHPFEVASDGKEYRPPGGVEYLRAVFSRRKQRFHSTAGRTCWGRTYWFTLTRGFSNSDTLDDHSVAGRTKGFCGCESSARRRFHK